MNASMFIRLIWKEYRTQRSLWLMVTIIALSLPPLLQIFGNDRRDLVPLALLLAFGMPLAYALGCGAVLFAGEREEGTSEMLRTLPTSPACLLAAKLVFGLASLALMFGLLFAYGWVLWDRAGSPTFSIWGRRGGPLILMSGPGGRWILMIPQLLLIGVLVSLLTRKVLTSVVVSGLLFAVISQVAERTSTPLLVHSAVYCLVLVGQIGLVGRWLSAGDAGFCLRPPVPLTGAGKNPGRRLRGQPPMAGRVIRESTDRRRWIFSSWLPSRHTFLDLFGYESPLPRLVWQEWRHAIVLVGPYAILATLAIVFTAIPHGFDADLSMLVIPLTPLLFGVWVFRGEQHQKRFRFAAERGVSPYRLWLSKQIVWLPLAAAGTCLFYLLDWSLSSAQFSPPHQGYDLAARLTGLYRMYGEDDLVPYFSNVQIGLTVQFVLYSALAYAAGQFASMLIPRAVTAVLVSAMITGVLVVWSILMDWLNVPLFWSVAPLPIVLLSATLVRTRGWMLERHRWQDWSALGAAILLPVALLITGVAYHRVHEIPANGPGFDVAEILRPVTAEEQTTGDMYRRAAELLSNANSIDRDGIFYAGPQTSPRPFVPDAWSDFTPSEERWLGDNQESLQLTLEATARQGCVLRNPKQASFDDPPLDVSELSRLILFSAKKLEGENKLDDALNRYLAVLRLERHAATLASSGQWIAGTHSVRLKHISSWIVHPQQTPERLLAAIRTLEQEEAKLPEVSETIKVDYVIAHRLAGEDWREELAESHSRKPGKLFVLQLLGTCFPWERARALRLHDAMTADTLQLVKAADLSPPDRGLADWSHQPAFWGSLALNSLRTTPLAINRGGAGNWMQVQRINYIAELRAVRLVMALAAWRLEHGGLPARLDDLVGPYFDELPRDPWSGQNFEYRPDGFPADVPFSNGDVPANSPLVWSIGRYAVQVFVDEELPDVPLDERVVIHSDYVPTNRGGLGFPVP